MDTKSNTIKFYENAFAILTIGLFIASFILGIESSISTMTIILAFISLIVLIVLRSTQDKEMIKEEIENAIESFKRLGLNDEDFLFNTNKTIGISFDEDNSNVIYTYRDSIKDDFKRNDIPFNKVLDVTINSNGSQLISTSKAGLLGGAVVGSLVTGGLGFGSVIGAMSANKTANDLVNNMKIIITLDDLSSPIISFDVIHSPKGLNKNSAEYNKIIRIVDEWFGKFTIIMKRNEKLNNLV